MQKHNEGTNVKNTLLGIIKNKTIIVLFINIIIVAIMLLLGAVQFESIDDYMIYELLSGKWGETTKYTIYINIFLSSILVWLFKIIPNVNWYVLILLITHIVSFTTLGYVINKKFKNGMGLYGIALILMYIPLLAWLQYTSQAAMLILVGSLLAGNIIENHENKFKLILPGSLIILGSMIRFGSILYILPYLAVIVFVKLVKKEVSKLEVIWNIVFFVVCLLLAISLKLIHTNLYNKNPIYKNYLEYNSHRALIHDYLGWNYETNKDVYDAVGWSENDYISMMFFNNADSLVFNIQNMKYIIKNVKVCFASIKEIFLYMFNAYFVSYLLIMVLILIISVRQAKYENIIIFIFSILISVVFILMGKVNIRTILLNYVIAIIFSIYNLKKVSFNWNWKTFVLTFSCILIIANIIQTVNYNKRSSFENSYTKFLQYVNDNEQNAYIYSSMGMNHRHIKNNILSTNEPKTYNLSPIASWLIYSENYIAFKEKYNIEEMYSALINKDNLYLITSNHTYSIGYTELEIIVKYIKEHYLVKKINIEEITNFDGNIYVYKLSREGVK